MKKEFDGFGYKFASIKEIGKIGDRHTISINYEGFDNIKNAKFNMEYTAHGLINSLKARKQIEKDLTDLSILKSIVYIFKKSVSRQDFDIINNIPESLLLQNDYMEYILNELLDLPKARFTTIVDMIVERRKSIISTEKQKVADLETKKSLIEKSLES